MARSPRQYSQRPVPKDFVDYIMTRRDSIPSVEQLENYWDMELAFQRMNDCPPTCTDFEHHQHPELKR